ncbi:MAG: hypothetical protein ACJ741_04130 [Pyrinomonadaceae bacterium]
MPTRAKKAGKAGAKKAGKVGAKKTAKSPAAAKTARYKGKKGGGAATFVIDPPIIIDGGGLTSLVRSEYVLIRSAVPLVPQDGIGDYRYVYRLDVDIKWMDWHGLGHKKDKSKDGKDFRLELYSTDEP